MYFKKKILTLAFSFSVYMLFGQYAGGVNDGFQQSLLLKTTITDNNAFRGGNDDGFSQSLLVKTTITDANAFRGGNDDGFSQTLLSKIIITEANAFRGGADDGFVFTLLPKIFITDATAFFGGSNDGFTFTNLAKINITDPIVFYGGAGRGETQKLFTQTLCTGDSLKWNGSVSTAWENPDNWDCGILPNINSIVVVPSGMPNYPIVSFSYEIKSMYLQPNTTVTVMPGVLFKLNGQ